MRHCLPDFWKRIALLEDPRAPERNVYGLSHVLCLAVLMFACAFVRAGRMRWKNENEGSKGQKLGDEREHFCACGNLPVTRALYLLRQIAHLFMQLPAKSNPWPSRNRGVLLA